MAVGIFAKLFEAVVDHLADQRLEEVIAHHILHSVAELTWSRVRFKHNPTDLNGEFLVGIISIDRLLIVRDRGILTRCRILLRLDAGEELDYLLLHLVNVEITYDDDTLEIGAIPLMIIIADSLRREVLYDFHLADRHLAILILLVYDREDSLIHTIHSVIARAPLLFDHATFGVDLVSVESDGAAPVVDGEKNAIHQSHVGGGHIGNVIDCLVEAGICIDIGTEANALALKIFQHSLTGEMGCAVEGHVLQEVGETELFGSFK